MSDHRCGLQEFNLIHHVFRCQNVVQQQQGMNQSANRTVFSAPKRDTRMSHTAGSQRQKIVVESDNYLATGQNELDLAPVSKPGAPCLLHCENFDAPTA
jgi:hypothetical protein